MALDRLHVRTNVILFYYIWPHCTTITYSFRLYIFVTFLKKHHHRHHHRLRSWVNFGARHFGLKIYVWKNKSLQILHDICPKMAEFFRHLPGKIFSRFFFWGGGRAPLPPSPLPMHGIALMDSCDAPKRPLRTVSSQRHYPDILIRETKLFVGSYCCLNGHKNVIFDRLWYCCSLLLLIKIG